MKSKTVIILCFLCTVGLYLAVKISKSNSADVYYVQTQDYDGGDVLAIAKLNELTEENLFNRDYYKASAYTDISTRWYANYNTKHQALLISGDPASGWSLYFYATPQELKMISDKKIPANKLGDFLKLFPQELLGECPTRSRDLFSIF